MRPLLAVLGAALVLAPVATRAVARPAVGELFTSEACSSCPPAEARIAELVRTRPDLLLLTFHVTYWNDLGWRDPYSLDAATERQRRYVALGISHEVYTPALVVDGRLSAVGSDDEAVDHALQQAVQAPQTAAAVSVRQEAGGLMVGVGPGTGHGTLVLVGYDRSHQTHVGRGENAGRTLLEANIVRSVSVIGSWSGHPLQLRVPVPSGQASAVLLQGEDGHIIGAARPGEG